MAECVTISLHLQVRYNAMILLSNRQSERDNLMIYCGMMTYAGYRSFPIYPNISMSCNVFHFYAVSVIGKHVNMELRIRSNTCLTCHGFRKSFQVVRSISLAVSGLNLHVSLFGSIAMKRLLIFFKH